jgi:HAD superfamily hydrolase (TIGR01490 family)
MTNTKSIALFDIDNTIYDGYTIRDILIYQHQTPAIAPEYIEQIMEIYKQYKLGNAQYEETAKKALIVWAQSLKGLSYDEIKKQTKEVLDQSTNKFFQYVQPIFDLLKQTHDIFLVTGEPQFIAEIVMEKLDTAGFISTEFEVIDGKFTGHITDLVSDREHKGTQVRSLMEAYDSKNSFAFGDSEGDINMLRLVEHSFCISPTDGLQQIAEQNNWHIVNPENVLEEVKKLL